MPHVLIADDQPDVLKALRLLLKPEGYRITKASSPAGIVAELENQEFDVLLMDLNFARDTTSGREGLDLLPRVQELDSALPVVVMTAYGSVEVAVEALVAGDADDLSPVGFHADEVDAVEADEDVVRTVLGSTDV